MVLIDPLGSVNLAPKYAKMLANGRLLAIRLTFKPEGVLVRGKIPAPTGANAQEGDEEEEGQWMDLPGAIAATAVETVRPWAEELTYKVRKFEDRLDIECPVALTTAANEAAWNAAMADIPFAQRKAFNMSNSDFEREYVRFVAGVGERRPLEAVIALEGANRGARTQRGRGRGGRGRGSAFQAQNAS